MQLFWRKGYAATSIEDLVEALQLSRSSLYDTFGDKRTLFLDALKRYGAGVIRHIERIMNEASSPLVGIQSFFDELVAGVGSEAGAMGCFMVNSVAELAPYDPDVAQIATDYSESVQRLLVEALTKAASQNMLPSRQTPKQLAVYLFNTIQGLRILIKSGANREQIKAVTAITLGVLENRT